MPNVYEYRARGLKHHRVDYPPRTARPVSAGVRVRCNPEGSSITPRFDVNINVDIERSVAAVGILRVRSGGCCGSMLQGDRGNPKISGQHRKSPPCRTNRDKDGAPGIKK